MKMITPTVAAALTPRHLEHPRTRRQSPTEQHGWRLRVPHLHMPHLRVPVPHLRPRHPQG
jgi:hypothetical protein